MATRQRKTKRSVRKGNRRGKSPGRPTRRTRHRRVFSQRELDALVERIRSGEHLTAIVRETHVNPGKLSKLCRQGGVILRRGRPANQNPGAPKRYNSVDWSLSDPMIAERLKLSRQAVHQMRHKLLRSGMIQPNPWGGSKGKRPPSSRK